MSAALCFPHFVDPPCFTPPATLSFYQLDKARQVSISSDESDREEENKPARGEKEAKRQ